MDTETFKKAYAESRNGANHFIRHPLVRSFMYSDGVSECAEAGCYWLLDIIATELPGRMTEEKETSCMVVVVVNDGQADINYEFEDGVATHTKHIDTTDMPDGTWSFYVAYEGPEFGYRCILVSEY